jgi:hypothetical protein
MSNLKGRRDDFLAVGISLFFLCFTLVLYYYYSMALQPTVGHRPPLTRFLNLTFIDNG